jgi:hypothetical protein
MIPTMAILTSSPHQTEMKMMSAMKRTVNPNHQEVPKQELKMEARGLQRVARRSPRGSVLKSTQSLWRLVFLVSNVDASVQITKGTIHASTVSTRKICVPFIGTLMAMARQFNWLMS